MKVKTLKGFVNELKKVDQLVISNVYQRNFYVGGKTVTSAFAAVGYISGEKCWRVYYYFSAASTEIENIKKENFADAQDKALRFVR